MTYYPDGTLLRRPGLSAWLGGGRRDAFGVDSTFGGARRRRTWRTFGWLEPGHGFVTGTCPGKLLLLREDAGKHPVNKTRGYQPCVFCPRSGTEFEPTPYTTADGTQLLLGDASIEVRDAAGQVWIAPTLVLHYIAVHHYLPPGELADARSVRAHWWL